MQTAGERDSSNYDQDSQYICEWIKHDCITGFFKK
jgi:hypothetical protein